MRITDTILNNNFIAILNYSTERLYEAENRVLTNKRVNKPSDDPVDAMISMTIRTRLSELKQYQRNINRAENNLNNAESAISELSDIFQNITTLTVQGASDSYSTNDKISIAGEVNQLLEQVLNLANTRSEDIYVFGGTRNDVQPYIAERDENGEIISVKTNGTAGEVVGLIGEKVTIKTNVNGEDIFEKGINLFDIVMNIRDNLRDNNTDALRENLNDINNASEKIFNVQAVIGSRLNRVYAAENRSENDVITFTEFLSDAEDIDAAQAIMDYQIQLITLQASLQAGSRLLQPKLIDFLR